MNQEAGSITTAPDDGIPYIGRNPPIERGPRTQRDIDEDKMLHELLLLADAGLESVPQQPTPRSPNASAAPAAAAPAEVTAAGSTDLSPSSIEKPGAGGRTPYTFASTVGVPNALPMEELVAELDGLWSGCSDYLAIREPVCAIHIALNIQRRLAPRFRPGKRPPRKSSGADYPEAHRLLSNDLQVVDLHWLRCINARLTVRSARWQPLARADSLDFALASDFAEKGGTFDTKVNEILKIRPSDQYLLAALQDGSIADKWRVITRGRSDTGAKQLGEDDVRIRLEEAARRHRGIETQIDRWVILWKCWRLSGFTGRPLAELYAFATGERVPNASNVNKALARLRTHLG